jgi:hypothetical protein
MPQLTFEITDGSSSAAAALQEHTHLLPLLAAADKASPPAAAVPPSWVREHVHFVLLETFKRVLASPHRPARGARGPHRGQQQLAEKTEFLLGAHTGNAGDAFSIETGRDDDRVYFVLKVSDSRPLGKIVPLTRFLLAADRDAQRRAAAAKERAALLDPHGLARSLEGTDAELRVLRIDKLWPSSSDDNEPFAGLQLNRAADSSGVEDHWQSFHFPFTADAGAADRILALVECILVCYPSPPPALVADRYDERVDGVAVVFV